MELQTIWGLISRYNSLEGGKAFFQGLGYRMMEPLPFDLDRDLDHLSEGARALVASLHQLACLEGTSPLRVYHVELKHPTIRRTDVRRFLESFYHQYSEGENLFVFSARANFDELHFVSPRRLPDPRDPNKVRLWLRILPVRRDRPYRTDLEVLAHIRADGLTADEVWKRHEEAFSVQRVGEQFFNDYSDIFNQIREHLERTHSQNGAEWARDYTHTLLNRIMFLYFIARKGWLLGPNGQPDRDFMRHFWEAYRERPKNAFHRDWLSTLFFEAFNNPRQNRAEYFKRFPQWLVHSLDQAPFLNGGLYRRTQLDQRLHSPLPDTFFELLFEKWTDGTFPGLFERYNFTVVETGRLDEEVAVDPEMLGTVYERLVNVTYEEDVQAGIFYTPRTEIDLMCRLALVDWLSNQIGQHHKDLLYRWVFALSEEEKREADQEVTSAGLWEKFNGAIRRVRVCDPACGSGSFLVGMLLVLDDLRARCNTALRVEETPYERRKRILQDQLYGVDVMEWAVRVAELRLWLQLVVETELPGELHFRPLLPNLNLKLRPGDSLLQTVGDLDFSPFRRAELPIPSHLKGKIAQLQDKKHRFFQAKTDLKEEMLKKEEQDLFRDILTERIHYLQNEISRKEAQRQALSSQTSLPGMGRSQNHREGEQRLEEGIQELRGQLERLQRAREALRPDEPTPFVWDIAFVEIFEGEPPGFDIVVGNPPYVRQEKIRDYLGRFSREEYLDWLNEGLRAIYPGFMGKTRRISGRADYYVYFYLHALSLLADKGSFCFITSNSWLDVDFGKDLQEFFLKFGHLKMVIDNQKKRSFSRADVNTAIVLAGPPDRRRPLSEQQMKERQVRFVAFRVPFEEALSPVVFLEIEDENLYQPMAHFKVLKKPEFRAVSIDRWTLWREGLGHDEEGRFVETRRYEGNKWGGKYLRAPDIFFTILEKGKDKLVRLGEIAEVRRGFTTGANKFFYLQPVGRTVKEVAELAEKDPMAPVLVKNGAGWEGEIEAAWLRPVIKSPREIRTLLVRLEDLRYLVFIPPEDVRRAIDQGKRPSLARYPKAKAYIQWGDRQGYQDSETCASRTPWWKLPVELGNTFFAKELRERLGIFIANDQYSADCRLYLTVMGQDIQALLNTSPTLMLDELQARQYGGGGGPRSLMVYEVDSMLFITPASIIDSLKHRLLSAFNRLANRPIRSIFEELGFNLCPLSKKKCAHPEHPYEHVNPEALTLEQVKRASPDRFELDSVVFDTLGLTEEERLQVYQAVAELVKNRLVKARSV